VRGVSAAGPLVIGGVGARPRNDRPSGGGETQAAHGTAPRAGRPPHGREALVEEPGDERFGGHAGIGDIVEREPVGQGDRLALDAGRRVALVEGVTALRASV